MSVPSTARVTQATQGMIVIQLSTTVSTTHVTMEPRAHPTQMHRVTRAAVLLVSIK